VSTPSAPLVLVVDDDDDLRDALVEALETRGFRCAGAGSVSEALGVIGRGRPDVILLDSVEGAEYFPEDFAPVVLYSGTAFDPADPLARRCVSKLRKPVSLDEMERVLRRALCPVA
jgi:DNA-binding NtrC family response regulator